MLRSEAITIIKRGLGFRQTQDAAIISALKQVQRDLELGQTLPNWLLVFDVEIPVVAGTGAYVLPPGFIRLHDDYPPYFYDTYDTYVELSRRRSDEPITTAEMRHYVLLDKTRIEFNPVPKVAGIVYLTYYKAALPLDSDIENAWLKHAPNYMIGLAGLAVAGDVRDKGAAEKFGLMAKIGGRAFIGDVVEDELAGRPLIMGRNN